MNRLIAHTVRHICILGLLLATAAPSHAEDAPATLGQHTVVKGDTLYCLGRAYRVDPAAIAKTNSLSKTARLIVGHVLTIPSVEWAKVPAGPVCAAQFQSPFDGSGAPQAVPVEAITPASAALESASTSSGKYTVQRGETLYRIATRFHITIAAIQQANGLKGTVIYAGQVLTIPGVSGDSHTPQPSACDPTYPTVCIPSPPPDLDCSDLSFSNFEVRAPDPHRFDLDNDGIGCEG